MNPPKINETYECGWHKHTKFKILSEPVPHRDIYLADVILIPLKRDGGMIYQENYGITKEDKWLSTDMD